MYITGADIGNAMVNTSEGVVFDNRVKVGAIAMNKHDIKITYNNRAYTIGVTDGALNIGKNKHKKINYKLALLTAIARSYKNATIDTKLVLGVPVEQFNDKDLINDIKQEVLSYGTETITVNGKAKTIKIHDVEVFCESGIVFSDVDKYKRRKTIVIDLGGSTIDISLWNGLRLVKAKTYKEGMVTLYENIIKSINETFKTNLAAYEAREMINKKEYAINQEMQNIEFINIDIDNYMIGLLSYINQYFIELDSCDSIELIGGGAIALERIFKAEYEKSQLFVGADFANANTYKVIGEMKWL